MRRRFCLLASGLALAAALIACSSGKSSNADQGVVVATVGNGAAQPPAAAATTQPATGATQASQPSAAATARPAGTTPAATVASGGNSAIAPELSSVIDNFAKVKSYRAKITNEGGPNNNTSVSIEAVVPDRSHFTATTNTAGGNLEVIIIGSDAYVKIAGTWTKQPASAAAGATALFDPKSGADALKTLGTAASTTKGGTDNVNGKSCQLYSWSVTDTSYQVCIADGLPQRVITQTSSTKTTIVFSDYNANITISAPI